ncbi:MAG: hydrolase TatD [Myxococcaceae bacterium]|nr:hydrolase TatD [Myxococcaceae bacterium]
MFDARLTAQGLPDADLETLKVFGVTGALVVPIAPHAVDDVATSWQHALEQRRRLVGLGFESLTCVGVPLSFAGRRGVGALLEALPRALAEPGVAALGPLMLHRATDDELALFHEQLTLARGLHRPVLVTAPAVRHEALTTKTLAALAASKLAPARVLIDGLGLKTVRSVLARGHLAGLTLHPERLDVDVAERMVHALGPERLVLGSGAGDGPSDLLALPRLVSRLKAAKLSGGVIGRVSDRTIRAFLGRS